MSSVSYGSDQNWWKQINTVETNYLPPTIIRIPYFNNQLWSCCNNLLKHTTKKAINIYWRVAVFISFYVTIGNQGLKVSLALSVLSFFPQLETHSTSFQLIAWLLQIKR